MKKITYPQVNSELDRIVSKKARVKRMMADADRHDPPAPKRSKRKTRKRKVRKESDRLGRFGSGGLAALMNETTRLLKESDPRAEWESGVAELREQYHANQRSAMRAVEKASAPRPGAPRRPGSPRSRTRSRTTAKRTH